MPSKDNKNPIMFQHTAARRRLRPATLRREGDTLFQHTAARRRLIRMMGFFQIFKVSTHSRPKAAAEGYLIAPRKQGFQHTAARRRLDYLLHTTRQFFRFNTQPPEGGC